MTTATDTPAVREIPTGHLVRMPAGTDLEFGTVWDGDGGEELDAVVVWTHELSDAETLWRARAYLEHPDTFPCHNFPVDWGWPDWRDSWPGVSEDLTLRVRRVWARWHVVEEHEIRYHEVSEVADYAAGDHRWVESAEPGESLRPVCVVELKP